MQREIFHFTREQEFKGTVLLIQVSLQLKGYIPDSQRFAFNHYLSNNEEDICRYYGFSLLVSAAYIQGSLLKIKRNKKLQFFRCKKKIITFARTRFKIIVVNGVASLSLNDTKLSSCRTFKSLYFCNPDVVDR